VPKSLSCERNKTVPTLVQKHSFSGREIMNRKAVLAGHSKEAQSGRLRNFLLGHRKHTVEKRICGYPRALLGCG